MSHSLPTLHSWSGFSSTITASSQTFSSFFLFLFLFYIFFPILIHNLGSHLQQQRLPNPPPPCCRDCKCPPPEGKPTYSIIVDFCRVHRCIVMAQEKNDWFSKGLPLPSLLLWWPLDLGWILPSRFHCCPSCLQSWWWQYQGEGKRMMMVMMLKMMMIETTFIV